jgi:hypothetical protein
VNLMKYKTKRVRRAAKTMLRDLRSSVVRIFLIASLSRQSDSLHHLQLQIRLANAEEQL